MIKLLYILQLETLKNEVVMNKWICSADESKLRALAEIEPLNERGDEGR